MYWVHLKKEHFSGLLWHAGTFENRIWNHSVPSFHFSPFSQHLIRIVGFTESKLTTTQKWHAWVVSWNQKGASTILCHFLKVQSIISWGVPVSLSCLSGQAACPHSLLCSFHTIVTGLGRPFHSPAQKPLLFWPMPSPSLPMLRFSSWVQWGKQSALLCSLHLTTWISRNHLNILSIPIYVRTTISSSLSPSQTKGFAWFSCLALDWTHTHLICNSNCVLQKHFLLIYTHIMVFFKIITLSTDPLTTWMVFTAPSFVAIAIV